MPISSTERALIATAIIACLLVAGAAIIFHRWHRPSQRRPVGVINFLAEPPDILSQLPPEAPSVAYADLSVLRSLGNSWLKAALGLAEGDPNSDREYRDFVRDTGFDYARDLDKVAVAYWPVSLSAAPGGIAQNRALAIAEGRFDQQKIKTYALRSGKAARQGTQLIYEVPGDPPVAFEFLSATRIALASGRNAASLLPGSHSPASSARDPAMQALIHRVSGAPIFAVIRSDALPSSFYASLKNSAQLAELARAAKDVSLAGAPQGAEFQLALDAECDSLKSAFEISTLLETSRMFGSMALADPKMRGDLTKEQAEFLTMVLRDAKITHDGVWVRIDLSLTAQMMHLVAAR
jgi:hypothetical protein